MLLFQQDRDRLKILDPGETQQPAFQLARDVFRTENAAIRHLPGISAANVAGAFSKRRSTARHCFALRRTKS